MNGLRRAILGSVTLALAATSAWAGASSGHAEESRFAAATLASRTHAGEVIRDTEAEEYIRAEVVPLLIARGLDPTKSHYAVLYQSDASSNTTSGDGYGPNFLISPGMFRAAKTRKEFIIDISRLVDGVTSNQAVRVSNIGNQLGASDVKTADDTYLSVRAKLEALTNPELALVDYPETEHSFPARYARATAEFKLKDANRSRVLSDALVADYPKNPYVWELNGMVLSSSGHLADAEMALRRSVELRPDAPLLHIKLAQILLAEADANHSDAAIAEYRTALREDPKNVFVWRLISKEYRARNMIGPAQLADAEFALALQNFVQAKEYAIRARAFFANGSPEWRRATDIFLASAPSPDDLKRLAQSDPAKN